MQSFLGRWCLLVVAWTGLSLASDAQTATPANSKAKVQRAPNPVLAQIEDDPNLPRVLLIGDSISMGYTLDVRKRLQGQANVHRIPTNGGPTTNGLKNIDAWLGDRQWDVIHFNWGLHDLKYVSGNSLELANPTAAGSRPQVPLAEYEANLQKLVERLQKTGATLIWCSTTPVPAGSNGRVADDELQYNAAAAKVMTAAGVTTNDLHAFALPQLAKIQLPKNVHFSPAGSAVLAEQVSAEISKALAQRAAAKK